MSPGPITHRLEYDATAKMLHWAAVALLLLLAGLGMGEATGVTDVAGAVIRLLSPGGTLVVEVDDPGVSVTLDSGDVVIRGAGIKEIRLKPGQYTVEVRTPSLDSVVAVHQSALTVLDADARVELRVPSAAQVAATLCGPTLPQRLQHFAILDPNTPTLAMKVCAW